MSGFPKILRNSLLAALVAGAAGVSAHAETTAAAPAPVRNCFYVTQWRGWKSPSPDVLYLRININDVYRVDLSDKAIGLNWPDSHLISQVRGSDQICSALDLDLAVVDHGGGIREHLFAKSMTKLTPAEVAALPPNARP